MAKKVPDFEFRKSDRHPWAEWTSGEKLHLERGKDYHCSTKTLVVSLHNKARALGMKVRTAAINDGKVEGLVIQFYTEDAPSPPEKAAKAKPKKAKK